MRRGLLAGGAGLLLALGGGLLALLDPANLEYAVERSIWPSVLAGLGALLLLASAWLEREALRRAMAARQARFGAFAFAYTAVVLVALVALAFLVERQTLRYDLTADRRSSLEEDTKRVLRAIPAGGPEVEVIGVVGGGGLTPLDRAAAEAKLAPVFTLLERSGAPVTTSMLDAAREPALARALGVAQVPSVAVRWQPEGEESRVVRTDLLSEREIARTIDRVLQGGTQPVYVVAGHGESSPIDVDGSGGLFQAMMAIAGDNYEVRPLNILEEGGVPEDASFLVIAGPQTDFVPAETSALELYLARGGRLLLLLGPPFDREGGVAGLPVLESWLAATYGLELAASLACDIDGLSGPGADLRSLVVPSQAASQHPILRGRDRTLVMPVMRPVRFAAERPHGVRGEVLFRSGPRSWAEAETPLAPAFDPADARGPHPLALAVTYKPWDQEKGGRILVVGGHLFASNAYLTVAGNAAFLLDAVAWLNERDEVLEARSGSGRDGTAVIPHQQGVLIILCAGAIPFVIAAFGVITWWHRRKL